MTTPRNAARRRPLGLERLEDRQAPALLATGSGPGTGPRVAVYDGVGPATTSFGVLSPRFTGGVRTAVMENGPGGGPAVVAAAGPGGGPHVQVLDTSGRLLASFFAYGPRFTGGVSVAAADVTGDGIDDIITGAGAGGGPHVQVIDGRTLATVRSFFAYEPRFTGGISVAAGDVTGDGRADVLVAAKHPAGGLVRVFDGATGAVVRTVSAFPAGLGAAMTVTAGDVTGDGRADVVAASGSRVTVIDGATGARWMNMRAFDQLFPTGVSVAAADVTGDGRADVLAAAGPTRTSVVRVLDGRTGAVVGRFMAPHPNVAGVGTVAAPAFVAEPPAPVPEVPAPPPPDPAGPSATFAATGPVAEGGTATVAFTDATGDGLTFSYDFDADGTFDVVNSASPTAALPAALTADGPARLSVRGRVTDRRGRSADYATTVEVTNAPPAAALGSFAGRTNVPVRFTATTSDPSPADAGALNYRWTFGDGSSSTEAAPEHAYARAGDYAVTLTVTDRDGATATATGTARVSEPDPNSSVVVTADYIQTPHDRIPNFGGRPDVVAVRSGNWSDAATWGGRLPGAGEVVSVGPGVTVTYDVVGTLAYDTVAIQAGGKLAFRTDVNTTLRVSNLLVMEGGELEVGTAARPVAAGVRAQITFPDVPIDTERDPLQYGHGLIALGKVTMHGSAVSDTFLRLGAEPRAGSNTLTLSAPVAGWRVGDRVALPDTHQLDWWEQHLYDQSYSPQWETRTITAVSADGRTLTLDAPLAHDHLGARDPGGVLRYLPHVALLSRNVLVRSENSLGERGHVFFTHRADVDVKYVQFAGTGRTTNAAFDDTTLDAQGNVTHAGTNQSGRYPVQFRHLIGPRAAQANGRQFTFEGNTVVCLMNAFTFRWGLTVHDSHYGSIRDNVIYNWAGSGVVSEVGNETGNVYENNYVSRIYGHGLRANDGMDGLGFWFRGADQRIVDNVATNIRGDGPYAYGFNISPIYVGTNGWIAGPAYQGADPSRPGESRLRDANAVTMPEFRGNEVYGATYNGLTLWWVGTYFNDPRGTAGVVKDFVAWHVDGWGYFGYESNNLTIDGFTVIGDTHRLTPDNYGMLGMTFEDYGQRGLVLQNIEVQGMDVGIEMPAYSHGDTVLRNALLKNYVGIDVRTMWSVHGGGHLPARRYILEDVRVSSYGIWPPGESLIRMRYNGGAKHNVVQKDEVFVHNFQGVASDDFQLYYTQQAADFIVPASGIDPGDPNGRPIVGAPEAGLTNAQAWAKYGVAVAGAVAPPTAQPRAGIIGLVRPL